VVTAVGMVGEEVAMTPPQCATTEAYFQKEFSHNGYIKSLKQLVHFYNTRDVYPFKVTSGHCPEGMTEKVDCWQMPEVPNNIDMTLGNLGLTDQEESQIVTFLQALTDGFTALPGHDHRYRSVHDRWPRV
jgi:cytochrome c peroxidase